MFFLLLLEEEKGREWSLSQDLVRRRLQDKERQGRYQADKQREARDVQIKRMQMQERRREE